MGLWCKLRFPRKCADNRREFSYGIHHGSAVVVRFPAQTTSEFSLRNTTFGTDFGRSLLHDVSTAHSVGAGAPKLPRICFVLFALLLCRRESKRAVPICFAKSTSCRLGANTALSNDVHRETTAAKSQKKNGRPAWVSPSASARASNPHDWLCHLNIRPRKTSAGAWVSLGSFHGSIFAAVILYLTVRAIQRNA